MDSSINGQKIQAVKKFKKAQHQFLYNLVLYSLTSLITLLFFTYPLWVPSMMDFVFSFPTNISLFFNAKCLFILGNVIVLILVRESTFTQPCPSPASEIYDEYVARSKRSNPNGHNVIVAVNAEDGFVQRANGVEELHHEVKKKREVRLSKSMHQHEEKKSRLRSCKSEVCLQKKKGMRVSKNMNQDEQEKKMVLRSSKSAVWSERAIVKREPNEEIKKKREIRVSKCTMQHVEEEKRELRESKSEVWGESEIVKSEGHEDNLNLNLHDEIQEEKGKEMWMCKSMRHQDEEKKGGLRASKSQVWGESAIVKWERAKEKKEDMPTEVLNSRVEAFIARVNRQRLLEATLLQDDGRG